MTYKIPLLLAFLGVTTYGFSQNNNGEVHGNFEGTGQYYFEDTLIGAPEVPEKTLFNGYANVTFEKGNFKAGVRFESYLGVLQGYDPRYKGTGIPYRYATYKIDELEVTAGNFYEQFGSGLALRLYEDKGLGIDNSLDGVRLRYNPVPGIYLKGLIGRQRLFFGFGPGIVRGFDGEINLNELCKKLSEKKTRVILGGSFVSKFQTDANPNLVLPQNVGLTAGRFFVSSGDFNISGEYAYKINDPSLDNLYVYKYGDAALIQMSYSKKGIGISLSAKRVDNMNYKSDRDMAGNNLTINYNPAYVKQHTYGMMAFYPYASQNNGEISWQAQLLYKFKKETPLGGKYGMDILLNYSSAYSLDTTRLVNDTISLIGYESNYGGIGDNLYWQDVNLEVSKKFNKKFKGTFVVAHQVYDIAQIQVKPGHHDVISEIVVVDLTYRITDDHALRMEFQHLYTEQEDKSWAHILAEYTAGEKFYFAAQDQYNYGNDNSERRIHYFNVTAGYVKGPTRISLGYGKQRAGVFCVGGVCRYVPASNGFTFTVSTSF